VVPSLAGFTPVENKSLELSLLAAKKEEDELPAIAKPTFPEPLLHQREASNRRANHHGSHTEVSSIPEQRRSAPESFLFPGSYTIPLSFAVTNKPPASACSDGEESYLAKEEAVGAKERPEYPWEVRNREIRLREERVKEREKPVPPPHSIESRPKAKT